MSPLTDWRAARDLTRALAAAIDKSGGSPAIDLSGLMRGPDEGIVRETDAREPDSPGGWGYWLLDVTITEDGSIALIEANGSNGALNSLVNGGIGRVNHIVDKIKSRRSIGLEGTVAVLPHGQRFHHIPEFMTRALQLVAALREKVVDTELLELGEAPKSHCLNVAIGDLPTVARNLYCHRQLTYHNAPVCFIQNGNILPELMRQGRLRNLGDLDLTSFHETQGVLHANDKGRQQELCHGTGFMSLDWTEADEFDDFITRVERMLDTRKLVVIKPSVGSQGIGVDFVGQGDSVVAKVGAQINALLESYGNNAELTAFPLRAFEWVKAKPISHSSSISGSVHLWDLRVEVLVSPREISAVPVIARICPASYSDAHPYNPDALKSNLSGRAPTTDYLLPPTELWNRLGGDYDRYGRPVLDAAIAWAEQAADDLGNERE